MSFFYPSGERFIIDLLVGFSISRNVYDSLRDVWGRKSVGKAQLKKA